LDLPLHLGSQRHGCSGGQRRARNPLARIYPYALELGKLRSHRRHLSEGRQDIGFIKIGLGHPVIFNPTGPRQGAPLDQGRGNDLSDMTVAVNYYGRSHDIVDAGDVDRVVVDGPVNYGLVDVGDPGDVTHGGTPVIGGKDMAVTAEISSRIVGRGVIAADNHGLRIKYLDIGRRHQHPTIDIRIGRGERLTQT
jgi:hypothetical protein